MWSDKTVFVLLQHGSLCSVHDSRESAEEHLAELEAESQKATVIDGPWLVHAKKVAASK